MKRFLVDTNVLVSYLTDRDPAQQEAASALFRAACEGDLEVIIHQFTLSELVFVLLHNYRRPPREAALIIKSVLEMPGFSFLDLVSWRRVLDLWPETVPAFADAVLAAAALSEKVDAVATFDRDLVGRLEHLGVEPAWT